MRTLAIVLFALSAFFIFYTVRLLAVTGALTHTRPGGQGRVPWSDRLSAARRCVRLGWRPLLVAWKVWWAGCLTCAWSCRRSSS